MKVYLNSIDGIADSIISLHMSKRSWTPEKDAEIREVCRNVFGSDGRIDTLSPFYSKFEEYMQKIVKFGPIHTTLLRYIDFSFTVEGLHRGAQDDFDSHAKRLENRIIRSSTRLASFGQEVSEYYSNKILTTDQALSLLHQDLPDTIVANVYLKFPDVMVDGWYDVTFNRTVNGYIRSDLEGNQDVQRGLYMLSIPSNFICKVNCAEFAHILKMRDKNSHAHPELQETLEQMLSLINDQYKWFNREFFYSVEN